MSAGRKPNKTEVITLDVQSVGQDAPENTLAQMRQQQVQDEADKARGIFDLGKLVGGVMTARIQKRFSVATEIRLFEEIKKSKHFKHLPIAKPDGTICQTENIDEFCQLVFGKGYKSMNEDSLSLRTLGEEDYAAATGLGLNQKQLRLIRSLPLQEREAVQHAIQSESKPEIISLLEDMAASLAESRAKEKEAREECEDAERLSAEKSKKIDALHKKLKRVQAAEPDEALQEITKEAAGWANDALGALRGNVRLSMVTLRDHCEKHGLDLPTVFMAGIAGQLQAALNDLRAEFDLPDVSAAAIPEWVRQSQGGANGG